MTASALSRVKLFIGLALLLSTIGWLALRLYNIGLIRPKSLTQSVAVVEVKGSSNFKLSPSASEGRLVTNPKNPAVDEFRIKWMTLMNTMPPNWQSVTTQQMALAKETVEALSCGEQLFELIELLRDRVRSIDYLIGEAVADFLKSSNGTRGRKDLALAKRDTKGLREKWSWDAGFGCPSAELARFLSSLGDERSQQNAALGHAAGLAATDPQGAISYALLVLNQGKSSSWRSEGMKRVVQNLPASAPFPEIERLLPADAGLSQHGIDPIQKARRELFQTWARLDPDAAVNHIIKEGDRLSPSAVDSVVAGLARQDLKTAIGWVRKLPDGPYFDAAALAMMNYSCDVYPTETSDLASRIHDSSQKQKAFEAIARGAMMRKAVQNSRE